MLMRPVADPVFELLCEMLPPLNLETGPWISGGAARKLWENKPWIAGDVDVFFQDWAQLRAWQKTFLDTLTVQVPKDFGGGTSIQKENEFVWVLHEPQLRVKPHDKFYLRHESENAVTYRMPGIPPLTGVTVQLIKCRFANSVQEVWDSFDFHNCDFATDGHTVVASEAAVDCCLRQTLLLKDSSNTKNLALRSLKYHLYGFEVSKELLLASLQQINNGELVWDTQY